MSSPPKGKSESALPDVFGLEKVVEWERDPAADSIIDTCEALTKLHAQNSPEVRERYLNNEEIVFEPYQKDKKHRYQLVRTVDSSGTTFVYRRLGQEYERSGFSLSRVDFGPTILTANNQQAEGETTDHTTMTREAEKRIQAYIKALGVDPKILPEYIAAEIAPDTRRQKIAELLKRTAFRPFTAPYWVDKSGTRYRSRSFDVVPPRAKVPGKRHVSAVRIALLASLIPIPGQDMTIGNVHVPVPLSVSLGAGIMHNTHHENARDKFDAKHLELPAEASIEIPQQSTVILKQTPPLPPDLANKLTDAPTLDADRAEESHLYGGPRRLTNLGKGGNSFEDTNKDLNPDQCEDIVVKMELGDSIRVSNIGANIAGLLSMEVLPQKIIVCNVSNSSIIQDKLEGIFVQAVRPRPH